MGRYYWGNITGKFWFGIQSSYDPANLGCYQNDFYEYVYCGCICYDKNISYCMVCYDNEKEHRNDYDENKNSLICKSDKIEWSIDISKIDFILEKIKEIESMIDLSKYITGINFEGDSYDYTIEQTDLFESTDRNTMELLARWCLAKQILSCLEDKEYYTFYGET